MGVCEVPAAQPLLVGRRTTSFRSSIFGSNRLLSPYTCHQMPLHNVFKITLHLGHLNCHLKSPVMCRSKARSSRESCKVSWMIEADLAEGQLLYITGDPIALGGWKPETAILMSPTEHKNIWKTDVKVPRGTNFKYNYFIRGDKWPSCDLIWRPGPEFSVSVPLLGKQKGRIIVRDSWMSVRTERLPVHSWGSWLEETYLSAEPVDSVLCKDDHGFCESPRSESLVQKSLLYELTINSEFYPPRKETKINGTKVWNSSETVSERYQPVEEPWLYQSSLFFLELKDNLALHKDSTQGKTMEDELSGKDHQSKETLEDESKTTCSKKPVSTDILINSSMCTMQRIAVLEDGKLVELLLEPVKTNVQCDSVYLGMISQLVPNMGGALVNIGTARTSLMDINQNREPFVFPPFTCTSKRKEANGSGLECKEESDAYDDQPVSHDDTEINDDFADGDFQDDRVQHMNGDFEEHETEDEFDVPDAPKRNMDGAIVDYNGTEEDGNGHHVDNETVKELLSAEVVGSHGSQPAHCVATSVKRRKKWAHVRKGTKVIVQVVKEGLGTKRPILTPYPNLRSRFWILITRCDRIGVSKKISGAERTRLRAIARNLQPPGFGLTVRTVAAGHSLEELQKDLDGLLLTWKNIVEHAKSAALAADEGVEGAIPIILHRAMGQTLSVAQDYFNEKVKSMVVDSPRTYHEITSYLQEIAPDLCDRVELYNKKVPIFSEYGIEEEIDNMLSKRVPLANGGSLVIEQTEALVSIDVNGGHGMLDQGGSSQKEAILEVNLAAAKQIARELRLRDIGGIIVVDFIDMVNDTHKRSVYEEVKKAVERDRSTVKVAELSRHGLMEITRKRVRPSVTFMISEPCTCCHATGRVEALETSFLKIENELYRLLAMTDQKADIDKPKSWPKFILRVDRLMAEYLTSGKRSRLALLSSSLKVWLVLKVARNYARGTFDLKLFTDDKENQLSNSRFRPTELGSHAPKAMLTLFPFKNRKTHRK